MMHEQFVNLIQDAYRQFVSTEAMPATLGGETRLFGGDSPLDSASLVSLVVEVEQQVNDQLGISILIADDRAMSQTRSPFRTIGSLAEYVQSLVAETREA
jgi:hypothetical protein